MGFDPFAGLKRGFKASGDSYAFGLALASGASVDELEGMLRKPVEQGSFSLRAMRDRIAEVDDAGDFWDSVRVRAGEYTRNPSAFVEEISEAIGGSATPIAASLGAGAAGAAVSGPGAPVGAIVGAALGGGAATAALEYGSWSKDRITQEAFRRGSFRSVLEDEDYMSAIREEAVKKGLTQGAVDGVLSVLTFKAGSVLSGARRIAATTALEAVSEPAGEYAGQVAAQGYAEPGDIAQELIMGPATGAVSAHAVRMTQSAGRSIKDAFDAGEAKRRATDAFGGNATEADVAAELERVIAEDRRSTSLLDDIFGKEPVSKKPEAPGALAKIQQTTDKVLAADADSLLGRLGGERMRGARAKLAEIEARIKIDELVKKHGNVELGERVDFVDDSGKVVQAEVKDMTEDGKVHILDPSGRLTEHTKDDFVGRRAEASRRLDPFVLGRKTKVGDAFAPMLPEGTTAAAAHRIAPRLVAGLVNAEVISTARDFGVFTDAEANYLDERAIGSPQVRRLHAGMTDQQSRDAVTASAFTAWKRGVLDVGPVVKDAFQKLDRYMTDVRKLAVESGFDVQRVDDVLVERAKDPTVHINREIEETGNIAEGFRRGIILGALAKRGAPAFLTYDSSGKWELGAKVHNALETAVREAELPASVPFAGQVNNMLKQTREKMLTDAGLGKGFGEAVRVGEGASTQTYNVGLLIDRDIRDIAGDDIDMRAAMQRAIQGDETELASLPKEALDVVRSARDSIDALSQSLINLGALTPKGESVFQSKFGAYLSRGYTAHTDASTKHITDAVRESFGGKARVRGKVRGSSLMHTGMAFGLDNSLLPEGAKPGDYVVKQPTEDGAVKIIPVGDSRTHSPGDLFKIVKVGKNEFKIWRDWTEQERGQLGEIIDASYSTLATFNNLAGLLKSARTYHDIAGDSSLTLAKGAEPDAGSGVDNPGDKYIGPNQGKWVRVPDTEAPGGMAKTYGALAGRWVKREVWNNFQFMQSMMDRNVYDHVMTFIKQSKTIYDPSVAIRNVISNFTLAAMSDVPLSDLVSAADAVVGNNELHQEAVKAGAFSGGSFNEEVTHKAMQRSLAEYKRETEIRQDTPTNRMKFMTKLEEAAHAGVKAAGSLDTAAHRAYQFGDDVFRMAAYIDMRRRGARPTEAAAHASEAFLNYGIRAPVPATLRRYAIPFLSFPAAAIPLMAKAAITKPWVLAYPAIATAAASAVLSAVGDMLQGDDGEELTREEKELLLPDYLKNSGILSPPKVLWTGIRDHAGDELYLDISRWWPTTGLLEGSERSAIPWGGALSPGGPAVLMMELVANHNFFAGKPIIDKLTDSPEDRTGKAYQHVVRTALPNWPIIPGSRSWTGIVEKAGGGETEAFSDKPVSMAAEIARLGGVNAKTLDMAASAKARKFFIDRDISDVKRAISRTKLKSGMSEEDRIRDLEYLDGKLAELAADQAEVDALARRISPEHHKLLKSGGLGKQGL